MATKPTASQEQDLVDSLNEQVSESWAQGEVGTAIGRLQYKKAPKAEPEEDIDVMNPGGQEETLQKNQTTSKNKNTDAIKLETTNLKETQESVKQLEQVPKKLEASQSEEEFQEPYFSSLPPLLSALSTEEFFDKGGFSSKMNEQIGEAAEDKEWAQTALFSEVVYQEVDSTSKEIIADHVTAEERYTQLHLLPDSFDNTEVENDTSGHVHHSPLNSNSDNVYTVCSPPFADESGEEEEVSMDTASCVQQWSTPDITSKPFSTQQNLTSGFPAVPSVEQQDELLPQSQCGLTPKGANQEAAQQVQGHGSPPLSTVAMEPSNQGGAALSVVAVRERRSREEGRTEVESKQTGEKERQKESGLERNKVVRQLSDNYLLRFPKTAKIPELKTEKTSCGVSLKRSKRDTMESDSCDDSQSDSGVSADFSPNNTLEGNGIIYTGTSATVHKETPIEREIRRAIEREHSLRRSRGLPNPPSSPEYVEVPLRKNVLLQTHLNTKSERCQGKDRQFAGKKMQHEIHEETQREQDLVKIGKIPGFYDKGTVRQLKERKQLFEAFQKPNESALMTVSTKSKNTSWSSASDISTLEDNDDILSQTSTIVDSNVDRRQSKDLLSLTESPNLAKGGGLPYSARQGPSFSEGRSCQISILENNRSVPAQKLYHARRETETLTTVDSGIPNNSSTRMERHGGINGRQQEKEKDEDEEEEVTPKENPFFKLRSSRNVVKVEQDIREAREREKELRKQRISLYGGTGGARGGEGGESKGVVERQSSTEGWCPTLSSASMNGLIVPDSPVSSPRKGTGSSSAHQSVGKLGVWPPPQAEEERTTQREVPRTPRQKTPLVQRWESGLVSGHNKEDD